MADSPLISVVIAAYNAERYLAEAVESVLAQTYQPVEIIVVDDGSTDGTLSVAEAYAERVRVEAQPHHGVAATLNHGLALAQGAYLSILDADDLWLPTKLVQQAELLAAQPEIDFVFCLAQNFISPEVDAAQAAQWQVNFDPAPAYNKGTMLIRRAAFARVGGFDPTWQIGDFLDWYAKAVEAGLTSAMVPQVLYQRRVHGQNLTLRERAKQSDYIRILKAALDRRRGRAPSTDSSV